MNIQDIINNIAEGDNLAAKEGLEHVLSAKAFDALQGYKQEIAATLYGGQEQESEEDTDYEEDEEGAYAEGVEYDEDQDQLDEVSMKLASSVYKNRKLDAEDDSAGHSSGSGQKRSDSYTKSGKHKMNISRDKIMSKPGGAQRVRRIDAITEEGVEHNDEQLEERAKWRTSSIAHNTGYRKDGAHGGIENTADTGKEDMLKNRGRGIRSGTPLTKSDTKSLKKSITKNMSQMKK